MQRHPSAAVHAAALWLLITIVAAPAALAINIRTQLAPSGAAASDDFGRSVSSAGDFNGDGFPDLIVGAPLNDAGATNSGRAYIYFGGPSADLVADLTLTGAVANDEFGNSVAGAGDVNGDGFDDVIVGAPFNDTGGTNAGRAYVYFGGSSPNAIADLALTGASVNDFLGAWVDGAGDVNGDGFADLIVGAPGYDGAGTDLGRAYVFYGGASPNSVSDLTVTGVANFDALGNAVAGAGDVNGDGFADVIVGAAVNDAGGSGAGQAYVYYGGPTADAVADLTLTGAVAGDQLGYSVDGAGDVNGDGFADVIVGAIFNDVGGTSAGQAYVFYGGPAADAVADVTLTGAAVGDDFGIAVAGAGDVNGDGFADVIVGAYSNDGGGANAGRAYAYFGGASPNTVADLTLTGAKADDNFAFCVAGAGDINGDGFDDLLVGARDAGTSTTGQAYLYDAYQYIVTSPNGGETWPVGSRQTISWLGRDVAAVSLSTDGGLSYSVLWDRVGGQAENEVEFLVPHAPTRFALVKIEPNTSTLPGHDRSDAFFTIETNIALLSFAVTAPAGGGAELAWSTDPPVGPQGIAGYRLYRSEAGAGSGDLGQPVGPALITSNTYRDATGNPGSSYRLTAVNGLGEEMELGREMLPPSALLAAWPTPFRGGTLNVTFASASGVGGGQGNAEVVLYDLAGRKVRTLARGAYEAGHHYVTWDSRDDAGREVGSGVYFLVAQSGGTTTTLKLTVAR